MFVNQFLPAAISLLILFVKKGILRVELSDAFSNVSFPCFLQCLSTYQLVLNSSSMQLHRRISKPVLS